MKNGLLRFWDIETFSKTYRGNKFLLNVIDRFSKHGWIIPLINKRGRVVSNGLQRIFREQTLINVGR